MFSCFKTDEKLERLTYSLKLECRNSADISLFSWTILVKTSASWHVIDVSQLKVPFTISSLHTSENLKGIVDFFLHTSPENV